MNIDLTNYSAGNFDRGASKLKECFWILASNLLFLPPWPMPSALRRFVLRLFGAKLGTGVVIRSGVNITFPWKLETGDYVWLGEDVRILNLAPLTIGSHVCLSQQAFLCTGSHDYRQRDFRLIVKPIVIGSSCWIAARAFVGPGVTIGDGSIIAATAAVLASVPSNSVVRSTPVLHAPCSGPSVPCVA